MKGKPSIPGVVCLVILLVMHLCLHRSWSRGIVRSYPFCRRSRKKANSKRCSSVDRLAFLRAEPLTAKRADPGRYVVPSDLIAMPTPSYPCRASSFGSQTSTRQYPEDKVIYLPDDVLASNRQAVFSRFASQIPSSLLEHGITMQGVSG